MATKRKSIPAPKEPFWDKEIPSDEIITSDTAKVSITICFKEGKKFISITRWYRTQKNPEWKPKSGIVLPHEKTGEIVRAVQAAAIRAENIEFDALL